HLGHFGWALGLVGQIEEGLEQIAKALDAVEELNERLYKAELHRLRGTLQHQSGLFDEAEYEYLSAIQVANEQKAKSWELRATTSLAKLLFEQGRVGEAASRLNQVYSWFNEGYDTNDLRRAHALLAAIRTGGDQ
ncbi:adenylate cyclase, partial [Rhizobiaceae sp. 2RAB30]